MSETSPKPKAPAGWYPHPSMAETQRYWDGAKWTDHIAPASTQPAPASATQQQPADLRHWIGALIVGGVLALIGATIPSDGDLAGVRSGLLGGGALIGIIAALKLASELMRKNSQG